MKHPSLFFALQASEDRFSRTRTDMPDRYTGELRLYEYSSLPCRTPPSSEKVRSLGRRRLEEDMAAATALALTNRKISACHRRKSKETLVASIGLSRNLDLTSIKPASNRSKVAVVPRQ